MKTKQLGWTDLHLTTMGLGTWAMGGGGWAFAWGPQDDAESMRTIYRALDLGINWIDTAAAYGLGHCEDVVGRALKGMSQKPILATKCGRLWDANGKLFGSLKADTVRAEVEASLRRLKVDTIDLYQIHWPLPDADIEEAWGAIAAFIKEGKVRYAGVSNFNAAQMKRLQPIHPVASLQPPYSLLARHVEAEALPYCAAHQIGVVAYSPMQKGLLTGKITRERIAAFPEDDHRRRDPQFQEPLLSGHLKFVAELSELARTRGRTVSELAIAWVLRRRELTAAIVGARNPSQIEETIGAADWELAPEDLTQIEEFLERRKSA